MSEENMSDSYEVGYGKPPRDTQFKKGVSGNPKGRPQKAPDFDAELIREFKSLITINDNERRTRIWKFQAIVKQLTNKALTGNISALRMFLAVCNQHSRGLLFRQHNNPLTPESGTTLTY